MARVGGITSVLLSLLAQFWRPAPVFIMGCVATAAGGLAFLFPETVGQKLPDTMTDAIKIGQDASRGACSCTCVNVTEIFHEELKPIPEKNGDMDINKALALKV